MKTRFTFFVKAGPHRKGAVCMVFDVHILT